MQTLTWFLFLILGTVVVSHRQGAPENEEAQSSYTENKFEEDFEVFSSSVRCKIRPDLPSCHPAEKRQDILLKLFNSWENDADSELTGRTKRQRKCRLRPGASFCKREDTEDESGEVIMAKPVAKREGADKCRPRPGASYCPGKRTFTGEEEVLNLNEILKEGTDED